MKSLVVYYSFEGDTKFIGDTIAKELGSDVLELKLEKEVKDKDYMKKYLGEKQVLMKTTPLLKPMDKNPNDYDLLIIGTPIWSGTYAPALRSFFESTDFKDKQVAIFYCFTVKRGRIFKHMKKALEGNKIVENIGFKDPLQLEKESVMIRTKKWASKIAQCLDMECPVKEEE
ncbi:MAG: flavodoxin [Asgard group archaeon]|nr:flavodoxin [Asgard group archaeon]